MVPNGANATDAVLGSIPKRIGQNLVQVITDRAGVRPDRITLYKPRAPRIPSDVARMLRPPTLASNDVIVKVVLPVDVRHLRVKPASGQQLKLNHCLVRLAFRTAA